MAIRELDQDTVSSIYNKFVFTAKSNDELLDKKTVIAVSNNLTSIQNAFNIISASIFNVGKLSEYKGKRSQQLTRERTIESSGSSLLSQPISDLSGTINGMGILSRYFEELTEKLEKLDLSNNSGESDIDLDIDRSKTRRGKTRRRGKLKLIGKTLGAAGVGLDVADRVSSGQTLTQTAVGVGGGLAGAGLGAKAGASIGAFFGGAGAIPGAAIGGIGGYFLGGALADKGYEAVTKPQLTETSYSARFADFVSKSIQSVSRLSIAGFGIPLAIGGAAGSLFDRSGGELPPDTGVLDAIAKAEGTYGPNGYNTSLGYGQFLPGGKEQNLTNKSLEEILQLGSYMRKQKDNPNSSALGRYQIVGTTLKDAASSLGYDLKTTKFSPEVQDRMAMWILKKQGFKAWEGFKYNPQLLQTAQTALREGRTASTATTGVGRISGQFGEDRGDHLHGGVDYATTLGTPVYALQSGRVTVARSLRGYGNVIYIQQDNGFQTRYAHLHEILVKEGSRVNARQLIGTVGSTGRSSGPHLHFEIRKDDKKLDPTNVFNSNSWIVGGQEEVKPKPESKINPALLKQYDGMLLDPKKRKTQVIIVEKPVPVAVTNTTRGPKLSSQSPRSSGNKSVNYYLT